MRYKLLLGVVASASVLAGVHGCSDDDDAVVTTDGSYVAPIADFDPAVDTAFWYDGVYDPVSGVLIASISPGASADGGTDPGADGGTVSPATALLRPLGGLLSEWGAMVKADCLPVMSATDNDQDRVPAALTATFNCNNQVIGDRTTSITGSVTIADADDNVKLSGFTVTFTNLTVATTVAGRSRTRTLNGTGTLTPQGSGTYQTSNNLTIAFDFSDAGGAHSQGTFVTMGQAVYTPDSNTLGDVFASGTVTLSGQGKLNRTIGGVAESRVITRKSNPTVHWNRSCRTQNRDAIGYDSGSINYADDRGSSLTLQFNGCGAPIVTGG